MEFGFPLVSTSWLSICQCCSMKPVTLTFVLFSPMESVHSFCYFLIFLPWQIPAITSPFCASLVHVNVQFVRSFYVSGHCSSNCCSKFMAWATWQILCEIKIISLTVSVSGALWPVTCHDKVTCLSLSPAVLVLRFKNQIPPGHGQWITIEVSAYDTYHCSSMKIKQQVTDFASTPNETKT